MAKKKQKHKIEIVDLVYGIIESILFVMMSFIAIQLLKNFTILRAGYAQGIFLDLLILIIIALLSLLIHPKVRTILLMLIFFCICCGCIHENTYYATYSSFSPMLYSSTDEVTFATYFSEETINTTLIYIFMMFIYIINIIPLFITFICTKKKGMKINILIPILSLVCFGLFLFLVSMSYDENDWSIFYKFWNREYIVEKFGVITYWIDDAYQSGNVIIKKS